jgi:DNA-binding MarR family transcriptional regulator
MTLETHLDVAAEIEQAMTALMRGLRMRRLHEQLNLRAGVALDRPSYVAIASLDDQGPMRVSNLAEACGVDTSTMSRLVERLLANGLIERAVAAADHRAVVVQVSAKGKRLLRRLKAVRREALNELLASWQRDEQQQFARLLSRFVSSLEQVVQEGES